MSLKPICFRGSWKLTVQKLLWQSSGTYNFPKIDSALAPGQEKRTQRGAPHARALSSV